MKAHPTLCLSFELGKCFSTGVKTPGIDVSMVVLLVGVVLRSGILSSEDSVKANLDCYLRELDRFKMANEQINS